MASKPAHIPEGFHTATPYLIVPDGAGAIEFYKKVFEATEVMREADSAGKVRHAQLKIGDSPVMLGEHQKVGAHGPESLPPVSIYLYVEDADATAGRAIAAGAKEVSQVKVQSYGVREGGIQDPFGIAWWIATPQGEKS